jgi:hypothetical protein
VSFGDGGGAVEQRTLSPELAREYRRQANLDFRLVAPPPDLVGVQVAAPPFVYDPGDAFGWRLPNGLVLFLWAAPPFPPLTDGAALQNPLGGFIGMPEGYHEDVGRAVATHRPFAGLPLVWGGACGSPLLFRWVGPRPDGQSWFIFHGAQRDLDELFRRAHAFASGYTGTTDAESHTAPDPGR